MTACEKCRYTVETVEILTNEICVKCVQDAINEVAVARRNLNTTNTTYTEIADILYNQIER